MRGQLLDLLLDPLPTRCKLDLFLLQSRQFLGPAKRLIREIGERSKAFSNSTKRRQARQCVQISSDLVHSRLDLATFCERPFILGGRPIPFLDELGIFRRQSVDTFPLLFQGRKLGLELQELSTAGAIFVKAFRFGPEIDEAAAQIDEARARREKELAQLALARENAFAAGL